MNKFELERRTKLFALKTIAFVGTLPHTKDASVIEYQLVKSGTSVGANYREANRGESRADFIHKIALVEKERLLKAVIGWSFVTKPGWATLHCYGHSCRNRESYSQFSPA